MGAAPTKYIETYGWTAHEALKSLDAMLAYCYGSNLHVDKADGRHFVMVHNQPQYVEIA